MLQTSAVQEAYSTSDAQAFTFRSPSLSFIREHLAADHTRAVLDLGMPSGGNVDFFARVSCMLYVEDLYYSLLALPPPTEPEDEKTHERRVAACLAHAPETRFDMIFAWDLINYMHPDMIHALMKRLSGGCRSRALLYFVLFTAPTIPSEPGKISISGDDRIHYQATAAADIPNPRYTPLKLERMMPGFRLWHSFLLGASLQEFLFRFD